jgi:terminase small subunit-like protein
MDDGVGAGSVALRVGVGRVGAGRAERVGWSEEVAAAVVAGTRAGKVLREVCAEPGMPSVRGVVRWAAERPAFGAALRAAREAAGLGLLGGPRFSYCAETGEAICARLCAGEAMVAILRDVEMPGYSTLYRWLRDVPEFREAVGLARDIQGLRLAELGWEDACSVTPETAFAMRVKLEHLRWYAGKLAPKKYGPMKAVEPGAGGHSVLNVYAKKFVMSDENGGAGRWSEEPAEHLYSMIPAGEGERGGERLPAPAVIREPESTRGADARGEPRGGAVEAEVENEKDDWWG